MIKYVIFDFDGTIADSKEQGFRLLNELASKYGRIRAYSFSEKPVW